jgi:predicted DNA binding protein
MSLFSPNQKTDYRYLCDTQIEAFVKVFVDSQNYQTEIKYIESFFSNLFVKIQKNIDNSNDETLNAFKCKSQNAIETLKRFNTLSLDELLIRGDLTQTKFTEINNKQILQDFKDNLKSAFKELLENASIEKEGEFIEHEIVRPFAGDFMMKFSRRCLW